MLFLAKDHPKNREKQLSSLVDVSSMDRSKSREVFKCLPLSFYLEKPKGWVTRGKTQMGIIFIPSHGLSLFFNTI